MGAEILWVHSLLACSYSYSLAYSRSPADRLGQAIIANCNLHVIGL